MIEVKNLYAAIEQKNEELFAQELEICINAAAEKINTVLKGEITASLPIIAALMERTAETFKADFNAGDNFIYRTVRNSIEDCSCERTASQGGAQ